MSRKLLISIGFSVLFLLTISLSYKYIYLSPSKILTVKQLVQRVNDDSINAKDLKVLGKIDAKSIKSNQTKKELQFYIYSEDNNTKLHVLYKGVMLNNNIRDGNEIIIEGKYTVEGLFIANKLTLLE